MTESPNDYFFYVEPQLEVNISTSIILVFLPL